eukprot:SM000073S21437  [mRNA]  locus=s73:230194:231182:+ [translate_table: standard]
MLCAARRSSCLRAPSPRGSVTGRPLAPGLARLCTLEFLSLSSSAGLLACVPSLSHRFQTPASLFTFPSEAESIMAFGKPNTHASIMTCLMLLMLVCNNHNSCKVVMYTKWRTLTCACALLAIQLAALARAQGGPLDVQLSGCIVSGQGPVTCKFSDYHECLLNVWTYDFRLQPIHLPSRQTLTINIQCPPGKEFPIAVGGGELRGNVVLVQTLVNAGGRIASIVIRNLDRHAVITTPHLHVTCSAAT